MTITKKGSRLIVVDDVTYNNSQEPLGTPRFPARDPAVTSPAMPRHSEYRRGAHLVPDSARPRQPFTLTTARPQPPAGGSAAFAESVHGGVGEIFEQFRPSYYCGVMATWGSSERAAVLADVRAELKRQGLGCPPRTGAAIRAKLGDLLLGIGRRTV